MAAEAPQLVFNSGLWGGRQEGRSQNRMPGFCVLLHHLFCVSGYLAAPA